MGRRRLKLWLLPVAILAALASVCSARSFVTNAQLVFGRFVPGSSPGSVTVPASGGARSSSGVTLLSGTSNPASFTLTDSSAKNHPVTVTFSSAGLTGSGSPMTLTNFTTSPANPVLSSAGTLTFQVGATLNVGANQARGNYSGNLAVTVNY
jgi:hypothetical protein